MELGKIKSLACGGDLGVWDDFIEFGLLEILIHCLQHSQQLQCILIFIFLKNTVSSALKIYRRNVEAKDKYAKKVF